MTLADRVVSLITERSGLVIAVMLLLSLGMGAGMAFLDDSSGLDQFQFDSEESEALDYIEANFGDGSGETTTVQIVVRGDDVLTQESFLDTLELQQDLRNNPTVRDTLATNGTFGDLSNVVATTALRQQRASELEQRRTALEQRRTELEDTAGTLSDGINETRALEGEFLSLNASFERGEIDRESYEAEAERLSSELAAVGQRAATELDAESAGAYEQLRSQVRDLQGELAAVEQQFAAGEIDEDERDQQRSQLRAELESVYSRIQTEVLAEEFATLEERGKTLESEAAAIESFDPTLDEQIAAVESVNDTQLDKILGAVLGEDAPRDALVFVPKDFERGSTEADARQLFVTQVPEGEVVQGDAPEPIVDAQLAIADTVEERFGDTGLVFGSGIISDEINRSMADSMAIVLPLALLFVVVVLSIAYRDPLDIVLGLFGIGLVLVWTFGFMGWADISFNQIMIAVPVLLVGLSIDYAIHVFMRHREERTDSDQHTRKAMGSVLLGLGAALVWVTVTAVLGFLSNLVSPVSPIQEFGVVSAFGIASTLLIFATFVPAAKVSLDSILEARGWDRRKRAFGTGGGLHACALGRASHGKADPGGRCPPRPAHHGGGAYGAAQVDTTFQQEDFIADEPAGWTEDLPEPFSPGEYTVKSNLRFVNDRFIRQDTTTQILLDGEITRDETLNDLAAATDAAGEQSAVATLSGEPDIQTPLGAMQAVAAENESFATTFAAADTNGDSVPDENLTAVYDAFFQTAPDRAGDVIYRADGEYESARMVISMDGDATAAEATDATREIAATLDRSDRPSLATGQLVVFNIVEEELFNTVIESLLITMVTVFVFLMIAYRFVHGSATLGAVTLTPILLSVAWILGSMSLLGIPFNVMTGTITSLTIGLGVAYSIHMSERYRLELSRGHDIWDSLDRAVTGTGGALLGSAATTAGGFGVLALAILPPLQDFGVITGLTIVYAFLASVFVLPSLLVLWTRYLGPEESAVTDSEPSDGDTAAPDDGPTTALTEYDPSNEDGPAGEWRPSMGKRPASPTRSVEPATLAPGSSYTATVTVPLEAGLTSLAEEPPGEVTAVETFGPEPLNVTATDGTVKAQWDLDTQGVATVRFTGHLPREINGGAAFEGTVSTTEKQTTVGGDTTLAVTAPTAED
ncbi:efflux RND transporter permease subunit [Halovenus salina]|uniref:MMPL family transporter n=1 Tax=Halovenus salina TaxID=1510225 RepID=A0ABD5W1U9_9EURY